jgi:hypothetical protein
MAGLRNGAMTGGAQCYRRNAERRIESGNESKIGRYCSDLCIGKTALHNS